MLNLPQFLTKSEGSYFMEPGAIGFIPPWILLLMAIFAIGIFFPRKFQKDSNLISPYFFAFILGSLMPIFDDLLAFVVGPPFAHHSLFHSLVTGLPITFLLFYLLGGRTNAKYALLGNLTHTLFNFTFDLVTLFFPLTYQEFGLTNIIKIDTFWIKAIFYPILLALFLASIVRYFRNVK